MPDSHIPEWVPSEHREMASRFWPANGPFDLRSVTSPEEIAKYQAAIKNLYDLDATSYTGTLEDLQSGKGTLTPKFVDRVLNPDSSYSDLWKTGVLKHPDLLKVTTPEKLKAVVMDPNFSSKIRQRALFATPETDFHVPEDLSDEMSSMSQSDLNVTDDKIAQIVNSSGKVFKNGQRTQGSFIHKLLQYQHEDDWWSGLNFGPKTEAAIANNPDIDLIDSGLLPQKYNSDENFDKFVAKVSSPLDTTNPNAYFAYGLKDPNAYAAYGLRNLASAGHNLTAAQVSKLVNKSYELKAKEHEGQSEDKKTNLRDILDLQKTLTMRNIDRSDLKKLYTDEDFLYHNDGYLGTLATRDPKLFNEVVNHYLESGDPEIRKYEVPKWSAIPQLEPETIDKIWSNPEINRKPNVIDNLVRNPSTGPNVIRDIHQVVTTDPRFRSGVTASTLYGAKNLPDDVAQKLAEQEFYPTDFKAIANPKVHSMLLDKVKRGGFSTRADELVNKVSKNTRDPELIRDIFNNHLPKESHDDFESDTHEPLSHNPATPSDVLEKLSDRYFYPGATLKHPNFPEHILEQWASQSPQDKAADQGLEFRSRHAADALYDANPDKYKTAYNQELYRPGEDHGLIQVKPTVAKLRVLRDKILEADPTKGEITPLAGQGPFDGGWKPLQEKNGNISAQKIQGFIDNQPSTKYRYEHDFWDGPQRHGSHHQRVFKLNVSTDIVRKLKEAGVYQTFRNISDSSESSGHPSEGGHTIGWVRYEHHSKGLEPHDQAAFDTTKDSPHVIYVDEIQTDMGPNTIKRLKEHPDRAIAQGLDPDKLETVNNIVFGGKNPSEVLLESFRQYHRNQGRHNVDIHMPDSKTKAPISGLSSSKKLPVHMKNTYTDMPKKLGFKPAKYGETDQQNNKNVQGQPIWTDKIRKFEDEVISKAIANIKPGKPTVNLNSDQIRHLPEQYQGKANTFDYSHLLSPALKRSGYRLYVNHIPEHHIMGELFHKNQQIGQLGTRINFFNPNRLEIHNAAIGDDDRNPKHRGKGLGTAMYEAVLAHAYHNGIHDVMGHDHSTMAHNVHKRLAEKHGLEYKAKKSFSQRQVAPGPYDDKYQGYQYMIKSEELEKAQKPEDFKSIVRATSQEGKNFVDDSAEHLAHPPAIASSADSYRTTIQQTPQVQKRQVGKASSGVTKKVLYQTEGGPKFMVKPYHEGIVRRISKWQKHPIQGWAEMTNQALYHAAGMGDLHQKVHVSHHDMGTGTPEPALVVELANGYKPSSEWKPIGEDTGRVVDWDGDIEPDEMRGAITYGDKLPGELEYKRKYHIHKTIEPDRESIRKIGLMDFLTNNLDRHHGNIMYDKAGKPLAIDHSRSFQYVNNWSFKHLNPTQVKRRADFSDEFGNYIRPIYTAVGAYEGSRLDMENWSPIINEWWPKNRDNVVNTMEQRLSQIKDPNVKNHIRRNFMERVGWLDERAQLGLENFGLEDWDKSPVQQYLPHQKSDWENEDGTGVRWNTKKE